MTGTADEALWRRAMLLAQQGRFTEAERWLRESIGVDPEDADILGLLANLQYRQDGGEPRALETIDRAVALRPNEASFHTVRSRILTALDRNAEAEEAAREAIRLDPQDADAFVARGWTEFRSERWSAAERSAREALERDPDNEGAHFLLSEALRLQGQASENRDAVRTMLARDPNDPLAHLAAGWTELQAGRRDAAEEHFLAAIRQRPDLDAAREGLLQAFKARAPWYASWLRLNLNLLRLSRGNRWLLVIGLLVMVRLGRAVFTGSLKGIALLIGVLYLAFALWMHLASGAANAMVLLDRRARHALTVRERRQAVAVGSGVFVGLPLVVLGSLAGVMPVASLGLGLFGAAIPFAYTFTNSSKPGTLLFGSIGVLAVVAGFLGAAGAVWPAAPFAAIARGLFFPVLLGVVATTWLCHVRRLYDS